MCVSCVLCCLCVVVDVAVCERDNEIWQQVRQGNSEVGDVASAVCRLGHQQIQSPQSTSRFSLVRPGELTVSQPGYIEAPITRHLDVGTPVDMVDEGGQLRWTNNLHKETPPSK